MPIQPHPDFSLRALSIDDAVKAAGIGRSTLYEEIRSGRLVARKVGRRTIITADDLNAWLDRLPRAHSPKEGQGS